jgi:hypothetical protein
MTPYVNLSPYLVRRPVYLMIAPRGGLSYSRYTERHLPFYQRATTDVKTGPDRPELLRPRLRGYYSTPTRGPIVGKTNNSLHLASLSAKLSRCPWRLYYCTVCQSPPEEGVRISASSAAKELVRSGSYMKPVDPLLHPPIVVHTVLYINSS